MKLPLRFVAVALLVTGLTTGVGLLRAQAPAPAPDQAAPQYKMITFYLCLLVEGPQANTTQAEAGELLAGHLAHLKALMATPKGVIAGPINDRGRLRGVLVLRTATIDEAKALASDDPAVKAGLFAVEAHPWFAADEIMKPVFTPAALDTYYFGFLVKGEKWTPEVTEESKRIQAGHMAHLEASGKSGRLVIAGPLSDNGDIRGILVYKTKSIDEARAIAEADPAVKAGRLKVELHPWMVSKGALP
jgi:uncharacterized protein YciI